MNTSSIVNKSIWTNDDFEFMGWHDCPIYGIRFDNEILIDLDYILKWELDTTKKAYSFWISPATLIFHNVSNLHIDINLDFINGIEILDINREILKDTKTKWIIGAQEGTITLIASGYTQYIRRIPLLTTSQCLSEIERNGYSFDKTGFIE